ncbi:MAG: porin family protein [Bacteroidales bacterium]
MKRILLLILALVFLCTGVIRAQAALLVLIFGEKAATENFHFSMKLGVNYSMIHGYEEGKNGVSLNFGVVNNIRLNDRFSLIAEVLPFAARSVRDFPVVTTGNASLDNLLVEVESADRKLRYLDIPVLLKWNFSDRFSLSAGPQFSYLVKAEDIYKSAPVEGTALTANVDIKSALRSVDVGGVIDFMYILIPPIGGKGVNLFARYSKGFIGILKDDQGPRYTSSMIQIGATFPFVEKPDAP